MLATYYSHASTREARAPLRVGSAGRGSPRKLRIRCDASPRREVMAQSSCSEHCAPFFPLPVGRILLDLLDCDQENGRGPQADALRALHEVRS